MENNKVLNHLMLHLFVSQVTAQGWKEFIYGRMAPTTLTLPKLWNFLESNNPLAKPCHMRVSPTLEEGIVYYVSPTCRGEAFKSCWARYMLRDSYSTTHTHNTPISLHGLNRYNISDFMSLARVLSNFHLSCDSKQILWSHPDSFSANSNIYNQLENGLN